MLPVGLCDLVATQRTGSGRRCWTLKCQVVAAENQRLAGTELQHFTCQLAYRSHPFLDIKGQVQQHGGKQIGKTDNVPEQSSN